MVNKRPVHGKSSRETACSSASEKGSEYPLWSTLLLKFYFGQKNRAGV
jgi:hypothetical protein